MKLENTEPPMQKLRHDFVRLMPIFGVIVISLAACLPCQGQWARHTIDDSSRGADGVRLGDVDGDGRQDLVCGWEEGGVIRVYLQPKAVREPWPQVTVGNVKSPEDAVFVDLDNDGRLDVVSSTEGKSRTLFVHWADWDSATHEEILKTKNWTTHAIACAKSNQAWMFALPMELDGRPGAELVVGSKSKNATISLLKADAKNRRNLAAYSLQPIYKAGWIMSLVSHDVNRDGRPDVVATDRKGPNKGVLWLENPGPDAVRKNADWPVHRIAGESNEVMFMDIATLNSKGDVPASQIITATRNQKILVSTRPKDPRTPWATTSIPNPLGVPHGKAVKIADINLDGRPDIIHTCNNGGHRQHRGAVWMEAKSDGQWVTHDISGDRGIKFDLIQTLDVDGDGDVDWLCCEERDNLGLFWYENPTR